MKQNADRITQDKKDHSEEYTHRNSKRKRASSRINRRSVKRDLTKYKG